MYGGETLGGNASHVLPEPNLSEMAENDFTRQARSERAETERQFREHFQADSNFPLHISLFTNSFMSFMYNDENWIHPYILMQKKITPFINTRLLSAIYAWEYAKMENYQLYLKVYEAGAPQMLEYPFFSRMTAFSYPGVKSLPDADLNLCVPHVTPANSRSEYKIKFNLEEPPSVETQITGLAQTRKTLLKQAIVASVGDVFV
jgi:hypothetical protein